MNLTGKDICAIISACTKSNVAFFKLSELEIHFGEIHKQSETSTAEKYLHYENEELPKETPQPKYQEDIYEIMIKDPVRYEQIMTGEVEINGQT